MQNRFTYPKSNDSKPNFARYPLNLEASFDFASSKTKFSAVKVRVFGGKQVNFNRYWRPWIWPETYLKPQRSKFTQLEENAKLVNDLFQTPAE